MTYSSLEFFLLMFASAALVRVGTIGYRKFILTIASLIFFAWAGLFNLLLMVGIIVFIWLMLQIPRRYPDSKKTITAAVIATLILHLFLWKYLGWTLAQFGLHPRNRVVLWILSEGLPIGISFYTLQGVAYVMDLYHGQAKDLSFGDFLLFKVFYGQLIAGPIVRYHEFIPQMDVLTGGDEADFMEGLELFAIGFVKKVVIANRMAAVVDPVFHSMRTESSVAILYAIVAYTTQIWADFSGYTDMGRGAARMVGIVLPINFNAPYLSKNATEFWRRWHITLGTWMRDFLYMPLKSNLAPDGQALGAATAIVLTMLIGGLWHGAAWTFVLWGLYQGVLISSRYAFHRVPLSWPPWVSHVLFIVAMMYGWLIFRVESFPDLVTATRSLVHMHLWQFYLNKTVLAFFAAAILIQIAEVNFGPVRERLKWVSPMYRGAMVAAILVLGIAARGKPTPFIYFQF